MIPRLSVPPGIDSQVIRWLDQLRKSRFSGDIETTLAARISVATDNSIYEVIPQAVLFPRSTSDVVTLLQTLQLPEARDIQIVPRGGGTGTNGQSLASGIVVDLSRHMHRIGAIDAVNQTVEVDPGVVLDDLNRNLAPHGYFFAPTLSPSDRATLGGMIGTNACGKGSRLYGRTVDHVSELQIVLVDGTVATLSEMDSLDARQRSQHNDTLGRLYRDVLDVVESTKQLVDSQWLQMPRSPSGYNLPRVISSNGTRFSLIPLLCGSEGTLGIVVGARLKLTPIPKCRRLLVLNYASFDDALASAEVLVRANPSAIETIDENILQLVRTDFLWHRVEHLLEDDNDTRAINLVEFAGNDAAKVDDQLWQLVADLPIHGSAPHAPIAMSVPEEADDIAAMWELRKKGVGLLGKMKGQRRPIPFVEDTAVPPARLAEYIRDFRALLETEGLKYGMFGHIDAGCLHVRPALDMRDPEDAQRLRRISDRVAQMVKGYGGVLWGEHGTGFRSEYLPDFFGPELFEAMCRIKRAFDPLGRLNRGKLAVVREREHRLVTIDSHHRALLDRPIAAGSQQHFSPVMFCNGNGQCFSTDAQVVMCPSSKVTRDRVHSPKGRAMLLKQWLRQLSAEGHDVAEDLSRHDYPSDFSPVALVERWNRRDSEEDRHDFSREVYAALDGCLSCKACATQCPIEVDIPRVKAEFLSLYHERYPRPLRDFLMAALEPMLSTLGRAPRLLNLLIHNPIAHWVMKRLVGLVDLPRLGAATLRLAGELRKHGKFDWEQLRTLSDADRAKTVLVLQDAFTTFFEPNVLLGVTELISRLGYRPVWVPYFPNGKALHIKGFMRTFAALARRNAAYLSRLASLGIDMVGIEPAVTLTYRDEYEQVVDTDALNFKVLLLHEWMGSKLQEFRLDLTKGAASSKPSGKFTFFGHCTEQTAVPTAGKAWQAIFTAFGLELSLANVGCCGMCGVFGHEQSHWNESHGIFELSWLPRLAMAQANHEEALVAGFSCRHQVNRFSEHRARHPVFALLDSGLRADSTMRIAQR
jgi:FAD/FMN-containing dehydrogenase/Fe-S oxidoreductase